MVRIIKGIAMLLSFIVVCVYGYYFYFIERSPLFLLAGTVVIGVITAIVVIRKMQKTRY